MADGAPVRSRIWNPLLTYIREVTSDNVTSRLHSSRELAHDVAIVHVDGNAVKKGAVRGRNCQRRIACVDGNQGSLDTAYTTNTIRFGECSRLVLGVFVLSNCISTHTFTWQIPLLSNVLVNYCFPIIDATCIVLLLQSIFQWGNPALLIAR